MLVLVSWLSALAASDSPRSLFYQTLIAPSGQGFFVPGACHFPSVSTTPLLTKSSRYKENTSFLSKDLIGKGPEDSEFLPIEELVRLKALGMLVGNIYAEPDIGIIKNPRHAKRHFF